MATSADHQKQKRILTKPRLLAQSIVGQFISFPESPLKRAGIIGVGILTGIGVPTLVFASQQQVTPKKDQPTSTSTVTVQSSASSDSEEAASSSGPTSSAQSQSDQDADSTVVINGESVPTTEQPISRQIVNSDGSTLDVNITIDNNSSGDTANSSNNTRVYINSNSSTTTGRDGVRGSPRR